MSSSGCESAGVATSSRRNPPESGAEPPISLRPHVPECSVEPGREAGAWPAGETVVSVEEPPAGREAEQDGSASAPVAGKSVKLGTHLDMLLVMCHLAFFGMIGVLIRSGLESLLGPQLGNVTGHDSALFVDLPANMVGSFVAGWTHVVLRKHIAHFSEPLAVGLSTGLCGSITTFASWNQRMLAILVDRLWVRALAGYLIGVELAQVSLAVGMDSAKGLESWGLHWWERRSLSPPRKRPASFLWQPDHLERRWMQLLFFFSASALMFFGASVGTAMDVACLKRRRLWFGLATAPLGVWTRWYLAKYNGQGIGKRQRLQWLPLGTFLANAAAVQIESVISLADVLVSTGLSSWVVGGLQVGLLGCMSTVSSVTVETSTLYRASSHHWRAYAYWTATIAVALLSGVLTYNVPIWAQNLDSKYNHIDHC